MGLLVSSENGDFGAIFVRVDFHCRVIFRANALKITCVKETEIMYAWPLGNVKVSEIQL